MGFKCGIVGLPNVGKSTLFNALTNAGVAAQNYPFCTIEPNLGLVTVPDPRLTVLADMVQSERIIPATIEFVDIAGLVQGAANGEGLGNKFLAHIRETDAIVHLLRCFEDPDITHVANNIDPLNDLQIINTELLLADLETVEKAIQKGHKNKHPSSANTCAHLMSIKNHLNDGKEARYLAPNQELRAVMQDLHLLTNKPTMYVANISDDARKNNHLTDLQNLAQQHNVPLITICAGLEAEISCLPANEQLEFLATLGCTESGLARLIKAGYGLLQLQTFFTAGKQEVRAWTIPVNCTAQQAAGKIHSDFEHGFIRAEVVSYNDWVNCNGLQGAKDRGKWRLEGKDYLVQDGDIMIFRFNV